MLLFFFFLPIKGKQGSFLVSFDYAFSQTSKKKTS